MAAFETFKAQLEKTEYLTKDVKLLTFKVPASFTFKAGQFASFQLEKNGKIVPKPYSIVNPPNQDGKLVFCMKIIPGGLASDIFAKAKPSNPKENTHELEGPFGMFTFQENAKEDEHWFICNGAGVAPFCSILFTHVKENPDKKFKLVFGCKTQDNLLFYEDFKKLAKQYRNFEYFPTLTREKWNGATGRVQTHLPEDVSGKMFYLCGFKDMVLDTRQTLLNKGVDPKNLKMERFN
jgi:ferredoxin-NADP reductase